MLHDFRVLSNGDGQFWGRSPLNHITKNNKIGSAVLVNFIGLVFLIGFKEEYTFLGLNKDHDTAAESHEAAAKVAGELREPPPPIFPAEAGEESAKAWASSGQGCTRPRTAAPSVLLDC